MRCLLQPKAAGLQGFVYQGKLAGFQIAQPAVQQLGRGTAGVADGAVLFKQGNLVAALA